MNQAVDGRRRGHRVFEDPLPLRERKVARDHEAASFVTVGQQRKEHLHLLLALLHVTQVVEDDRFVA